MNYLQKQLDYPVFLQPPTPADSPLSSKTSDQTTASSIVTSSSDTNLSHGTSSADSSITADSRRDDKFTSSYDGTMDFTADTLDNSSFYSDYNREKAANMKSAFYKRICLIFFFGFCIIGTCAIIFSACADTTLDEKADGSSSTEHLKFLAASDSNVVDKIVSGETDSKESSDSTTNDSTVSDSTTDRSKSGDCSIRNTAIISSAVLVFAAIVGTVWYCVDCTSANEMVWEDPPVYIEDDKQWAHFESQPLADFRSSDQGIYGANEDWTEIMKEIVREYKQAEHCHANRDFRSWVKNTLYKKILKYSLFYEKPTSQDVIDKVKLHESGGKVGVGNVDAEIHKHVDKLKILPSLSRKSTAPDGISLPTRTKVASFNDGEVKGGIVIEVFKKQGMNSSGDSNTSSNGVDSSAEHGTPISTPMSTVTNDSLCSPVHEHLGSTLILSGELKEHIYSLNCTEDGLQMEGRNSTSTFEEHDAGTLLARNTPKVHRLEHTGGDRPAIVLHFYLTKNDSVFTNWNHGMGRQYNLSNGEVVCES